MPRTDRSSSTRAVRSLTVPGVCVAAGAGFLWVGIAHHRIVLGVAELAIMLAYAAFLIARRRSDSEPAALLAGDTSDERRVQIQLRAGAATGSVLIVLVVAGLFWSIAADNRYVGVFTTLAAVGGISTVASTYWFSRRA